MPKTVKPKMEILNIPKIGAKVAKVSKPRKVKVKVAKEKIAKPVMLGGHYRGTGSIRYWWSDTKSFKCLYCEN